MKKALLAIVFFFFLTSQASAVKEIWVLYDNDGTISGSGRIDREWCEANRDGSTILEFIERKISLGDAAGVLYLPNGKLPDRKAQKVDNGAVVSKSAAELAAIATADAQEALISAEVRKKQRKDAIKALKAEGKLPPGYPGD